jgi:hypothetical protein
MAEHLAVITITNPANETPPVTVEGVQVERITWGTAEPGRFVGHAPLTAFQATCWPLRDFPRAQLRYVHPSGEEWSGEVTRLTGHSQRGITIEARTCPAPEQEIPDA